MINLTLYLTEIVNTLFTSLSPAEGDCIGLGMFTEPSFIKIHMERSKQLRTRAFLFTLMLIAIAPCYVFLLNSESEKPQPVTFTILQLNDVYEIGPLSGGTEGGMARVATIRNELLKQDTNTITMLAGDFISPSLMGTLKFGNQAIAGKQMVEVMNELGTDYVTFGNHEFDYKGDSSLIQRINESEFTWISCNVRHQLASGKRERFYKSTNDVADSIAPWVIRVIHSGNDSVRVGIIGATLPFNKAAYVNYDDVNTSVKNAYNAISGKCDLVIALTHLDMEMDKSLAAAVPGLTLIIGGHEHTHMTATVGNTIICKADANAKSVYIHRITFDPATGKATLVSELKAVDSATSFEPEVNKTVNKWLFTADSLLRAKGYQPDRKLMTATVPLDGRESSIRSDSTNFTVLITKALRYASPGSDVALFNSGSLRVDDQLEGDITEYDILRSLPFGGPLIELPLTGAVLQQVLDSGTTVNVGSGGYLQKSGAEKKGTTWEIGGVPIDPKKTYKVFMPKFVADGKEKSLGFLRDVPNKPATASSTLRDGINNDIRDVVIAYMLAGMPE